MEFTFASGRLRRLYTEEFGAHRYPAEVVDAFFKVMEVIAGASDERDLRSLRSRHFEKLKGDRKHQCSMRLSGGFRLILELQSEGSAGKCVRIVGIEDYHKG